MAQGQVPAICFRVGPSRWLAVWLLFGHGLALGVALAIEWIWQLRFMLALAVLLSLLIDLRLHVWRRAGATVKRVCRLPDGSWRIDTVARSNLKVVLLSGGLIHPWLTILRFRDRAGRNYRALVFLDNVDATSARRLRRLLKRTPAPLQSDVSGGT